MADALPGEWAVHVHTQPRVIEVVYPARPADGAADRYEASVQAAVTGFGGKPFDVLIDQRAMPVLSSELSDRVVALSQWEREQGMRHMVRVVRRSAIAELQARKVLRDAGVDDSGRVLFHTVEEAWAQLRSIHGAEAAAV